MAVEITETGDDDVVLAQVATDGGYQVTHQGSTRNRIEQVAASGGLGPVPAVSDRNAVEWLAGELGAGYVSCVYTLTDDPMPGEFAATVESDGITASYLVQGQLNPAEAHSVKTTWESFTDISASLVAVQMNVGAFPVLSANAGVHGAVALLDDTEAVFLQVIVLSSPTLAGGYRLMAVGDGAPVAYELPSKPEKVGITLDYENGQALVKVDGVDAATAAIAGNGTAAVAGVGFMEYSGNDAGDAGEKFEVSMVTNAADMDAAQFVVGAVDLCGNGVAA